MNSLGFQSSFFLVFTSSLLMTTCQKNLVQHCKDFVVANICAFFYISFFNHFFHFPLYSCFFTERAMNYLFFPLAFALLIWWGVQRGKMINIRLYPRDRTLLRYQILKEKDEWNAFAERTRFVHDLEFSIVSVCSSPNFTYIFMRQLSMKCLNVWLWVISY